MNIKRRSIWLLLLIWLIVPYNVYGETHCQQSSDGDDCIHGRPDDDKRCDDYRNDALTGSIGNDYFGNYILYSNR